MLYNVVLVFAIHQHESAIGIHSGRNLCAQMFFFLSFFFFFLPSDLFLRLDSQKWSYWAREENKFLNICRAKGNA